MPPTLLEPLRVTLLAAADVDVIGDLTVHNATTIEAIAHDAADIIFAVDSGIGENEVLHGAVFAVAEETLVIVVVVDADAADGVAVAVEGA